MGFADGLGNFAAGNANLLNALTYGGAQLNPQSQYIEPSNTISQQQADAQAQAQNNATLDAQNTAANATQQAAAEKAAQLAVYDQGIGNVNSGISRLASQKDVGLGNIDTAYNQALNQLLLGKARGQSAYDTSSSQALQDYTLGKADAANTYNTTKSQTAQDYVAAKNNIGAQAGSSLNSLLRLLGSRGAGGSSAATIAAPQAVARNATLQRGQVGQDFGRNQQALDTSYNQGIQNFDTTYGRNKNALDTNWQNYLQDLQGSQNDLNNQKINQTSALNSSIDQNKATLLQSLASLQSQRDLTNGLTGTQAVATAQPFYDEANQLLAQVAAQGRQAPVNFNANPSTYNAPSLAAQTPYQAPSLASYTVNPNAAPTYQGQAQGNDYTSPYLAALLGKKRAVA